MSAAGIDSIVRMQQLVDRLDQLRSRTETGTALDDLMYLMEALDPQLQDSACQLVEVVHGKPEQAAV